jgi:hypothetical protein
MNGTNKDSELRTEYIEAQELGYEKGFKKRVYQEIIQYMQDK